MSWDSPISLSVLSLNPRMTQERNSTLKHLELMADKLQYDDHSRYPMIRALQAPARRALIISHIDALSRSNRHEP